MGEPSKRIWPWKKKPQDKAVLPPELVESSPRASHNSKFFDEQDVSKILSDHARVSDEAMTQWQHSEVKLKQLSDELHAAQAEITAKDILVKQHAKVAEEAVTGWEKAEAEAAALKQQLDSTMHQKLATEDRVSHLDGALKECMKQLRHVREEQEQRIHETIVNKTREYDKLRQEMEAKLAEVSLRLQDAGSEVLECRGECHAMSVALEESRKLLAEFNDSKARSETEARILQSRLESCEKESSNSKYELQILKKELEIRNEEREFERKVIENDGKTQVEKSKKIAELEAECHRLRILVRKKLPGPAALTQMKAEVAALDAKYNGSDLKKRSSGVFRSIQTSPRDFTRQLDFPAASSCDIFPERSGPDREAKVLAERLVGMDDEMKILKEALVRRDQELQVSRLMCAKTASKLSRAEEQLDTVKKCKSNCIIACGFSQKDGSNVGNEASVLLAELDQFKRVTEVGPVVGQLDLMDDFAEMEKLAMATGGEELGNEEDCNEVSEKSCSVDARLFEDKLIAKERELEDVNRTCKEINQQLFVAEERLSALQSRNSANEAVLITLQEKLDRFGDKQDGCKDHKITKELEDLVEAQSISLRTGAANEAILFDLEDGSQNGVESLDGIQRYMSSRSSSEVKYEANEDLTYALSDAESKCTTLESDLLQSVRSVVSVVADLVEGTGAEDELSACGFQQQNGLMPERQVYSLMQWKNPDLNSGMQSLFRTSNKLLQGKTDVVDFLTQLATVLNFLLIFRAGSVDKLLEIVQSTTDCANGMENREEIHTVGFERVSLESQIRGLEEDSHSLNRGKLELQGGSNATNKRSKGMTNHFLRAESFSAGVSLNGHIERELHEWSISKCEPEKAMLLFHNKVAVLEELKGERQQLQEMTLKYLDLDQQVHSGGAGSNSSTACSESEWAIQRNLSQPPLVTGDVQVGSENVTKIVYSL